MRPRAGFRHDPRVAAMNPRERWAVTILVMAGLGRGGRLPDYPNEYLSDSMGTRDDYAMNRHEAAQLIKGWEASGLLVRVGDRLYMTPAAYEGE